MSPLLDLCKQCVQHSLAPKTLEREAVPDVGLAGEGSDRQLELADPLRFRGQPSVASELVSKPRAKAAAPSAHPRSHEVALGAHGRDHRRGGGWIGFSNLLNSR